MALLKCGVFYFHIASEKCNITRYRAIAAGFQFGELNCTDPANLDSLCEIIRTNLESSNPNISSFDVSNLTQRHKLVEISIQ